jgi:hypothetical protein
LAGVGGGIAEAASVEVQGQAGARRLVVRWHGVSRGAWRGSLIDDNMVCNMDSIPP